MSDDDNKKKKFNPFLAPTEKEDEPKLDDDEDTEKTAPVADDQEMNEEGGDEEFVEEDDGGDIAVENIPGDDAYEEELVDEMTAQPAHEKVVAPLIIQKTPGPRSWSFYALGLLVVLFACNWLSQTVGTAWFWTPRSIYIMSYVFRTAALLIAAYAWHQSLFKDDRATFRAVYLWIGIVSGVILAVFRFISDPSFWAFINMAAEPIDSALLALFSWYIVAHLTSKLKIIKQTV